MDDPTRDPLAQHPLGGGERRSGRTLELFPRVGDAELSPAESPAPSAPPEPLPDDEGVEVAGEPLSTPMSDADPDAVAFARRMVAGLADVLILALVGAVELAAGAFLLELRFPTASLVPAAAFLLLVGLVLLVLAPFVWGTTPGMALADLRIRAADGGSPTLSAAFLRFIGFVLTGALAGVPLLVAAFDRRGRTLSDLLSGTTLAPAGR
jgi:uncharacterized RDD family membrane protein YckC